MLILTLYREMSFGKPKEPVALRSKLGWIVSGSVRNDSSNSKAKFIRRTCVELNQLLLSLTQARRKCDLDSDVEFVLR